MATIPIGGRHLRLADPDWDDPLDASYAKTRGGRWNASGSFDVLYLNRDERTARANLRRHLIPRGIEPEDLEPDQGPDLVATIVPDGEALDIISDTGCTEAGLPVTYPLDHNGTEIPRQRCQPIGHAAHDDGLDGVACRSAADSARQELAWFPRGRALAIADRTTFPEWQ